MVSSPVSILSPYNIRKTYLRKSGTERVAERSNKRSGLSKKVSHIVKSLMIEGEIK